MVDSFTLLTIMFWFHLNRLGKYLLERGLVRDYEVEKEIHYDAVGTPTIFFKYAPYVSVEKIHFRYNFEVANDGGH